uniref:RRM domain-containing protein n=1 Tax=Arundo donax TaxID=35708 RepID=A0A0A9DEJ2_ARUDO
MQRKIFVGNVHADVDVDRLYEYFSQFGEIEEGPLGFDKNTGKPKGFALFVYKSVESARRALEEPVRNFDGKMLNVQKAIDGRTKGATGTNANANSNTTAASASAAAAQMTAPASAAISPYDASAYGATAVTDLGFAQQAAMLGLGAQQQAFAQPNAAVLAMMAAAMQNPAALGMTPAMLAAMNPFAAAAFGAGGQQAHTAGLAGFGAQGFGTQAFGAGGAAFPNASSVQAAAAAYQGAPPGFQGPPGFQVGQATTQTGTAAVTAGAAGYQAGAAGQGQVPGAQIGGTGFQGGY